MYLALEVVWLGPGLRWTENGEETETRNARQENREEGDGDRLGFLFRKNGESDWETGRVLM